MAEALPERVDVEVFDRAGPEVGAGDLEGLAAELEEVEGDDRRGDEGEEAPLPPDKRVDCVAGKHKCAAAGSWGILPSRRLVRLWRLASEAE